MLLIVKGHSLHSGGPIKKNEIGRACGTYGEDDTCIQGLLWVT